MPVRNSIIFFSYPPLLYFNNTKNGKISYFRLFLSQEAINDAQKSVISNKFALWSLDTGNKYAKIPTAFLLRFIIIRANN